MTDFYPLWAQQSQAREPAERAEVIREGVTCSIYQDVVDTIATANPVAPL